MSEPTTTPVVQKPWKKSYLMFLFLQIPLLLLLVFLGYIAKKNGWIPGN